MSWVGKSSATLTVSETFKEEGEHALKAELKPFSLLNALHSLRSSLFNLPFEGLLSFKLNSSWSVTNLMKEVTFFKRNIENGAFPWEYGLMHLQFFSCLIYWVKVIPSCRPVYPSLCLSVGLSKVSQVNA